MLMWGDIGLDWSVDDSTFTDKWIHVTDTSAAVISSAKNRVWIYIHPSRKVEHAVTLLCI